MVEARHYPNRNMRGFLVPGAKVPYWLAACASGLSHEKLLLIAGALDILEEYWDRETGEGVEIGKEELLVFALGKPLTVENQETLAGAMEFAFSTGILCMDSCGKMYPGECTCENEMEYWMTSLGSEHIVDVQKAFRLSRATKA